MGRGAASEAADAAELLPREPAPSRGLGYLGSFQLGSTDIARGWRLPEAEIATDHQTNARHGSRMIERRIAKAVGGRLAGEGAPFDVELEDGTRIEVRCFTRSISFASSGDIGARRSVSDESLSRKLNAVDAFVLCDVSKFPRVTSWLVPADQVQQWRQQGVVGEKARISAKKLKELLADAPVASISSRGRRRARKVPFTDSESKLILAISVEVGLPPKIRRLGRRVGSEVFAWLSDVKRGALLAEAGVEPSSSSIPAARKLLDVLASREILALSSEEREVDELHFLQFVRVDGKRRDLLLELALAGNAIDLVARHAARPDGDCVALAFADALHCAWVVESSPECTAAGYAAQEEPLAI